MEKTHRFAFTSKALLKTGLMGTVIAALCCFTPVLLILAGALGLSALTGYFDYVLLPALAFFVALTVHALHRKRKEQRCCEADVGAI
jgi:mercuric ion transport protein